MDTNRLQKQAIKYKKYWLRHLQVFDKNNLSKQALQFKELDIICTRMDTNRLTKQAQQYKKLWQFHVQRLKATDYQNKDYNVNKIGYNMYIYWTQTDYQNKHYNINNSGY